MSFRNYSVLTNLYVLGIPFSGIEDVFKSLRMEQFATVQAETLAKDNPPLWEKATKVAIVRDPIARAYNAYLHFRASEDQRTVDCPEFDDFAVLLAEERDSFPELASQKEWLDRKIDILVGYPHLAEFFNDRQYPTVRWTRTSAAAREARNRINPLPFKTLKDALAEEIEWLENTPVWVSGGKDPRTIYGKCESCTAH